MAAHFPGVMLVGCGGRGLAALKGGFGRVVHFHPAPQTVLGVRPKKPCGLKTSIAARIR